MGRTAPALAAGMVAAALVACAPAPPGSPPRETVPAALPTVRAAPPAPAVAAAAPAVALPMFRSSGGPITP
ncbi:hypothetical protein ICW40_12610, partial [Actinotalea ferrariae]|nr:hypothetical protein [Actinotalea ferrariae]